jgi:GT2 family glycosyltransferase
MAPDALAEMLAELERHPEAGALGPALFYPDGSPQPSRRRFPSLRTALVESTPIAWHWPDLPAIRRYHMLEAKAPIDAANPDSSEAPLPPAGPVDWVTGAAILFRSPALAAAGGFDEGFFMYSEELDLCRRLRDLGWTTRYTPAARVVHHEGKSSEQVVPRRHRMFQRSRLRYFRKHHGRAAAALLRAGILGQYALELALEASKLLLGHRPELRRARIAAYWSLLRDGLGESSREGRPT